MFGKLPKEKVREEPIDPRRVFDKIFKGQHSECRFDVWTQSGKHVKNLDYGNLLIGARRGDFVIQIRLHCKTCSHKTCSLEKNHDHFIRDNPIIREAGYTVFERVK